MKRCAAALLALVLAVGLAACGGQRETGSRYETEDVQAMADAGAFSETLEELDGDTAFALYRLGEAGLERSQLTGCALLRSAGATCEEGAVLVFDTEDHAQTAQEALERYVQGQIEANRDYRPAEIPKLEDAVLDRRENTLLLVVAADTQAAKDAV